MIEPIPGEYARAPEPPPYNRPDVPVNPPVILNSNHWSPGDAWPDGETLPWLAGDAA